MSICETTRNAQHIQVAYSAPSCFPYSVCFAELYDNELLTTKIIILSFILLFCLLPR